MYITKSQTNYMYKLTYPPIISSMGH